MEKNTTKWYYVMLTTYWQYWQHQKKIEGIKAVFKLKGGKGEVPDMYLSALIQKVQTLDGTECWMMYVEKYVKADVENVKLKLSKSNRRKPSCCDTPMDTTYHPS